MKKILSFFYKIIALNTVLFLTGIFVTGAVNVSENELLLKKVYQDISNAMGITADPPSLGIAEGNKGFVAYIDYEENRVYLEKQALDLCISQGGNAANSIALLLGHELAHFFFKHDYGQKFASSYSWKTKGAFDSVFSMINTMYESQADSMGGIFSFLAGYNTTGIAESFLPLLYNAYNLPDTMDGYPVLAKRIEISKNNDVILKRFIKIFETANFLLITNHFNDAQRLYDFLIRQGYNSREIFNNSGLAYVFEMIKFSDVNYKYPLEIDLEHNNFSTKSIFDDNLEIAVRRFEQAIRFDPGYATSYLNLACTYTLANNLKDADFYLGKALEICRKKKADSSGIYILYGIHADMKNDKKSARKFLTKPFLEGNPYADFNLAVVNFKLPKENINVRPSKPAPELIDGINVNEPVKLNVKIIRAGEAGIKYQENSRSVLYYYEASNHSIIFLETNENYSGATALGIKTSDPMKSIISGYGNPDKILLSRNGSVLVYNNLKMFFLLDSNENLKNWVIFNVNSN